MMESSSRKTHADDSSHALKLVVGLGNPGEEYHETRHNTGFMVVDALLKLHPEHRKTTWQPSNGELYEVSAEDGKALLVLKPMTYMNSSGDAVVRVTEQYGISPLELLVICDDMDLPVGKLRMRPQGSSGGQRGVGSIIARLGTDGFARLRVGIGRPQPDGGDVIQHVLSRWTSAEKELLASVFERACAAVCAVRAQGLDAGMRTANAWQADNHHAEKQKGERH